MDTMWLRVLLGIAGACSGIYLLIRPRNIANGAEYFADVSLSSIDPCRLAAAVSKRVVAESISAPVGRSIGAAFIILAGLTALLRVPFQLLYPLFYLIMGGGYALAFTRFRRSERRAAGIAPRSAFATIPSWIALLACAAVVAPGIASNAGPAMRGLMILPGVVMLSVAWLIATAPTLIAGDDVAVEAFVDAYLRRRRASVIIMLAVVLSSIMSSPIFHGAYLEHGARDVVALAAQGVAAAVSIPVALWGTFGMRPTAVEKSLVDA